MIIHFPLGQAHSPIRQRKQVDGPTAKARILSAFPKAGFVIVSKYDHAPTRVAARWRLRLCGRRQPMGLREALGGQAKST